MTREEAAKILKYPVRKWSMEWSERDDGLSYTEALDLAIAALRGPTREQAEKVWRAHWNESTHLGGFVYCSRCGYNALEANNYTFCPKCGSPFTDEAVQIVMERLEALCEDNSGEDDCFDVWSVPKKFMGNAVDRLAAIEDILGNEYDLDHLHELAQADREERHA